jgi:DNA repair exonuclease SbcCD nuclease subunit
MPPTFTPFAIGITDLHLQKSRPIAVHPSVDWMAKQREVLDEISILQRTLQMILMNQLDEKVDYFPVICAGDVFDSSDPGIDVLNLAARYLPKDFYFIPGQHDLPHHSYLQMERSALGVLDLVRDCHSLLPVGVDFSVEPPRVAFIENNSRLQRMRTHFINEQSPAAFATMSVAWGKRLDRLIPTDLPIIGVTHRYAWAGDTSPPFEVEINKHSHVDALSLEWSGCDVLLTGDNHQRFCIKKDGLTISNSGSLLNRTVDQKDEDMWVTVIGKEHPDADSMVAVPYALETKVLYRDDKDLKWMRNTFDDGDVKRIFQDLPETITIDSARYFETVLDSMVKLKGIPRSVAESLAEVFREELTK